MHVQRSLQLARADDPGRSRELARRIEKSLARLRAQIRDMQVFTSNAVVAGTATSIGKIITGLRWKYVCDPLIMRGKFDPSFDEQVAEVAMTIAAGLDAGIY